MHDSSWANQISVESGQVRNQKLYLREKHERAPSAEREEWKGVEYREGAEEDAQERTGETIEP